MSEKSNAASTKIAVAQLVDTLTERILSGQIPAGGRLKESVLAQEFQVSRNTVRGALAVLDFQGLSRYERNRGWVVWRPTQEDLLDVHLTRFYLETAAARTVGPGKDFTALEKALNALVVALETGDPRSIVETDLEFHAQIVALMGSRRLNEYYERLAQELKFSLFVLSMSDLFGDRETWGRCHVDIFYALTSGDPERAVKAVGDAVLSTREDVRRSFLPQDWPSEEDKQSSLAPI